MLINTFALAVVEDEAGIPGQALQPGKEFGGHGDSTGRFILCLLQMNYSGPEIDIFPFQSGHFGITNAGVKQKAVDDRVPGDVFVGITGIEVFKQLFKVIGVEVGGDFALGFDFEFRVAGGVITGDIIALFAPVPKGADNLAILFPGGGRVGQFVAFFDSGFVERGIGEIIPLKIGNDRKIDRGDRIDPGIGQPAAESAEAHGVVSYGYR